MADIEIRATGQSHRRGHLVERTRPSYVHELWLRNITRPYVTVAFTTLGRARPLLGRRDVDQATYFHIREVLDPARDRLLVLALVEQDIFHAMEVARLLLEHDRQVERLLRSTSIHVYEIPLGYLVTHLDSDNDDQWIRISPSRRPSEDPDLNDTVPRPEREWWQDQTAEWVLPTAARRRMLLGGSRRPRRPPAFTRVDCPDIVTRGVEFELIVGLGPEPDSIGDAPLDLPASGFVLDVHVIAPPWLSLRRRERWRHQLFVSDDQPYPVLTVHPTASTDSSATGGTLEVLYRVDSRLVGRTQRAFSIAGLVHAIPAAPPQPAARSMRLPLPKAPPVDIEITVERHLDDPVDVLRWTYDSHHGMSSGEEAYREALGAHPEEFAASLVRQLDQGGSALAEAVLGLGRTIARTIPEKVWEALGQVALRAPDGIPTVLIQTSDPHVPWELAALERPLNPATGHLPLLLGAHTRIGRWNPRDQLDPVPHDLVMTEMAVIEGGYRPRLRQAAQEAKRLHQTYGATLVKARMPDVLRCMRGTEPPGARALHFAVHGTFVANDAVGSGLRLADREYLSPVAVQGTRLANQPFVFLNACQVASGSMLLGMSASLPDAFLAAQAMGVVAPLWSVHDSEAMTIAIDFYRSVLDGVHPAEFVRRLRASTELDDSLDRRSASRLAYQFYGHPVLTIRPTEDQ